MFDRDKLVAAAERATKRHREVFLMSDSELSFVVVGVKEKNGDGWYSQFVRTIEDLESAPGNVERLRLEGLKLSPPYFNKLSEHDKWIESEKQKAML